MNVRDFIILSKLFIKGLVPRGGTTGQILTKNSDKSFDLKWITGGGGGGSVETVNEVIPDEFGNVSLDVDDIPDGTTYKRVTTTEKNTWNGKQDALGYTAEDIANKSTNVTTDGASDTKYPSVKAVKDYADGLVVGLLNDRGNYDASGNVFPSGGGSGTLGAIKKGDIWLISVAGTLGTKAVSIGDQVRALVDTPGQTASNWSILEVGLGYIPENAANKDATGGFAGLTGFAINLKNAAGTVLSSLVSAATQARTWTFPDKDGTIALISDIPNAKLKKIAKYIVTTAFVANEEITLTTGAGAAAGVTTASGDCTGVKGVLGASANAFRDDNTIEVLENGVEMWKSVDVIWVSQDAENGDKIKFPAALDVGDTFVVKYFV